MEKNFLGVEDCKLMAHSFISGRVSNEESVYMQEASILGVGALYTQTGNFGVPLHTLSVNDVSKFPIICLSVH